MFCYERKTVDTLELYDNPLELGDDVFWYCIRRSDGLPLIVPEDRLFSTYAGCETAEEQRNVSRKKFFDGFPATKRKE